MSGTPADYSGHTPADVDAVSNGIKEGGTYPKDLAVAAYSYPTQFDRLPEVAVQINHELALAGFPERESLTRQMLAMGEETGEFLGAVRRFFGMARRAGTWEQVLGEWADVVITTFVTANILGISRSQMEAALAKKIDEIFTRGWHEPVSNVRDAAQGEISFTGEVPDEP